MDQDKVAAIVEILSEDMNGERMSGLIGALCDAANEFDAGLVDQVGACVIHLAEFAACSPYDPAEVIEAFKLMTLRASLIIKAKKAMQQ